MKLSTAIRLGAMMKPQHFGDFFNEDKTASCALGAAFDATHHHPDVMRMAGVIQLHVMRRVCPQCGLAFGGFLAQAIPHLNDGERWTREQIADWVEGIERELDAAQLEHHEADTSVLVNA